MTEAAPRRRVWFAGGGTGGHLYPGLAIARALVALDPSVEPYFVGAARGIERTVLPGQPFAHVLLDLHPIYRQRPWENWKTLRGAFGAWRTLDRLAADVPPALVVGTGGYAMGLAAAWGGWNRVPVVQQVADVVPGLTAKLASRWSRELYLGFPEAAVHLSGGEKIATGNPIEPPPTPRPDRATARVKWGFPQSGGRVVLVFGGSQGARAINDAVAEWIRRGVGEGTYVLWATGTSQHDRYASLDTPGKIRVLPYLSPISEGYAAADLAVTRAGAMTCAELTAWGIPSVMIPLPTAAADHQTTNARALEDSGCAVFFPQSRLTPESLGATVAMMVEEPGRLDQMGVAAKARARPNAAKDIAQRVLMILKG